MQRIGFIVFPGSQVMVFAALSVFELANHRAGAPLYDVRVLSEDGGEIPTSVGMAVATRGFDRTSYDTLIVGGGLEPVAATPGLIAFVRRSAGRTRRIASICTGAFVLAQAGVLDGKRATTHWAHASLLRAEYPAVKVEDDRIFIHDGGVWTSAGMSAGIDLALAMVEEDHGVDLARLVAKKLVVYHRRAGGQSQHSVLLDLQPKSDRIQSALTYAKQNLRAELSVDELAQAASLSRRQFSRSFRAETGRSPAKAVEHLRVEAARLMMEQTNHPIEVIARETGFADPERMRRAFLRAFSQPPQMMRRAARATVDVEQPA